MKTKRNLTLGVLSLVLIGLLSFGGRNLLHSGYAKIDKMGIIQSQMASLDDSKETGPKSEERKEPESNELDEEKSSVSTLTFNFIYYLIYKIKPVEAPI